MNRYRKIISAGVFLFTCVITSTNIGIVRAADVGSPFACEPVLFQTAKPTQQLDGSVLARLFTFDPFENNFAAFTPTSAGGPNAIGYNTADNYLYGIDAAKLVRIDASGTFTNVSTWSNVSFPNAGDFWGPNRLVVSSMAEPVLKIIDVSRTSSPFTPEVLTLSEAPGLSDFTILGDTAYGLQDQTLKIINLNTGNLSTKSVPSAPTSNYGSSYADATGNLYFFANNFSTVWMIPAQEVSNESPAIRQVGTGTTYVANTQSTLLTIPNDGASCPNAVSPYSADISAEVVANVTSTSAVLSASINPVRISSTAKFCVGTSPATSSGALMGCTLTGQPTNASESVPLTGQTNLTTTPLPVGSLEAHTTYYWQVITTSMWATTYGEVQTFTTTGAPIVSTQSASAITGTRATVHGLVNPGGREATAEFCYGTSPTLEGCSSATAAQSSLPSSRVESAVDASLTGLVADTVYYVRVSSTNSDGTTLGRTISFTTGAAPVATVGSATDVTPTDGRANATVATKGLSTTVTFCVGRSSDLTGCSVIAATQSPLIAVDSVFPVSVDLTDLAASTRYYYRTTATNDNGSRTSAISTFVTRPLPLTVEAVTGSIPQGVIGSTFSKTLTAAGGTLPYVWRVSSGTLPTGLELNANTGNISGIPSLVGDTTFTISVTDQANVVANRTFPISIVGQPNATTGPTTLITGSSATLSGTVNPSNMLTAVNFCLGTSANLANCNTVSYTQSPLIAGTANVSVVQEVTGLAPATTYFVRINAENGAGPDTGSTFSFTTAGAPIVTTGRASDLRSLGTAGTLTGSVNPSRSATTASFCYGTTPTLIGCTSVATTQTSLAALATVVNVSAELTGLVPNTVYYFTLRATNGVGSTSSTTENFTTPTNIAPAPVITNISPAFGPDTGGTTVTISGANYSTNGAGTGVTIGGQTAIVTQRTATTLRVTTPAGTAGLVDVIVTNTDGQEVRQIGGFIFSDTTAPNVSLQRTNTEALGVGDTDIITFTLSEDASDFVLNDVTVTGGSLSAFSSISSNSYTAVFTPTIESFGQAQVSIAPGTFSDAATNLNSASSILSISYDTIAPTVVIARSGTGILNSTESDNVTFTLSEESEDFVASDVIVTGGSLSALDQLTATSYSARFTPTSDQSDNANVRVRSGVFTDSYGNRNVERSPVSIQYDTLAPTVLIERGGSGTIGESGTETLTFTLSEQSSDFAIGDISVSGGLMSSFRSVSGVSYAAVFTPTVGASGTASISVTTGMFRDPAGNGNASSFSLTISYNTVPPALLVTTPPTASPLTTVPVGTKAAETKTVKKGTTHKLSAYVSLPKGTKSFRVSGPCTVNKTRLTFTASKTKTGTCAITVTGTSKSQKGKTVKSSVKLSVRVK